MRTADLYVRVSTDEQADKGYSIRSQEEVLRKFCGIQNIAVRRVIHEDYSAKTFNRPAWSEMLKKLKKEKGKSVDLLLFTKWDRFSRNAGDAYQMINTLRKAGVDPQAVEQPLDLTIPENKMMLAFYLAAPEVENDRRALNTFYGMRRARKEGRYLTTGPYGYINRTDAGKKTIVPVEPQAGLVRWAFEQIAQGPHHIDNVRREIARQGFACSKSHFYNLLRNPTYCGKIIVPEFRDEPRQLVPGLHEPIVSESLFYQVQEVLEGKKRIQFVKISTDDNLPLRGFLLCPKCGKQLTGSASKGRSNYYYYYHCTSSCGERHKADQLNDSFIRDLNRFVPKPGVPELYRMVINDIFRESTSAEMDGRKELLSQIQLENNRLIKARRLLLDDAIDTADFKAIKLECENKITILEGKLTGCSQPLFDLEDCVNKALITLSRISITYEEGDVEVKRSIISSIYPEKMYYENTGYRTARVNKAAELVYLINSKLGSKKNRTNLVLSKLSDSVAGAGLEPTTFGL